MEVVEHIAAEGRSPFGRWFLRINAPVAAKVTVAIARLTEGNVSNAKSVGNGLHELRIQFDPGYRVCFGNDGLELIVLLAGEVDMGRAVMRDLINATVGFGALAESTGTSPKSLMRMFGPGGNPTADRLFPVISSLQNLTDIRLQATVQQ